MPEGDTIHRAARRVEAALLGKEIVAVEASKRAAGLARRLAGHALEAADAHGKHLLLRFDGGVTLHSHLRMTGMWAVYEHGQRWRRSPTRAWLVLRTRDHDVVQFDGPVLELVRNGRARVGLLGPDILAERFDEQRFLRRLRDDDQGRAIGDALLDQRTVAGVGNIWKAEGCFLAGIDPWRPLRSLSDAEALALVAALRPEMRRSAAGRGRIETYRPRDRAAWGTWVYRRAGLPCRRCSTPVRARGQGDDNRTTYWCAECQR